MKYDFEEIVDDSDKYDYFLSKSDPTLREAINSHKVSLTALLVALIRSVQEIEVRLDKLEEQRTSNYDN